MPSDTDKTDITNSTANIANAANSAKIVKAAKPAKTTKLDLITHVSRSTGLTQSETKIAVEELLSVIAGELENGNSIELRGFGTFYSKERKARPARNPKTGEVVPLKKRYVALFKYAGDLKKRITLKNTDKVTA